MIKSISNRFVPDWLSRCEWTFYPINPNRITFWFELFHNCIVFYYIPGFAYGLNDNVQRIKNPDTNQILGVIDGKDIVVEGSDLRYLVEHYICKDLVVSII